MSDESKKYVVMIGGLDNIRAYFTEGTEDEIKQCLYEFVMEDRDEDPDRWEYGTGSKSEVIKDEDGSFYAGGVYSTYSLDYVARAVDSIKTVKAVTSIQAVS